MGHMIEDNCVGCESCVRCGRDHESVYYCDECGDYTHELYDHEGKELCWECYKAQYTEKICDDMDETKCSSCGCEAEEMFQIEGHEWVCEDCLMDLAEKVDTEGEPYDPRE